MAERREGMEGREMDREASAICLVVVVVSVAMTESSWPRSGGGLHARRRDMLA